MKLKNPLNNLKDLKREKHTTNKKNYSGIPERNVHKMLSKSTITRNIMLAWKIGQAFVQLVHKMFTYDIKLT